MRRELALVVAVASLWACGGTVFGTNGDAGTGADGGSSSGSGGSSSSGGSSGGSSSSSGGSTSSSGGSSSSGSGSGGSSSSSGGSSSGGRVPVNHRPNDAQCSTTPAPGTCNFGGSSGGPGFMCTTDSDCADAGLNGRCVTFGGGPAGCGCTYDSCVHDNDCTGETCACHGSPYMGGDGNRCVPGNCHIDTDCGPAGYCSPSYGPQNCGALAGYYCHTPNDQCIDDSDCSDGGFQVCAYSTTDSRWECAQEVFCALQQ